MLSWGLGDERSLWRTLRARLAMTVVWAAETVTRTGMGEVGGGEGLPPHNTLSKKAWSGGIVPLRTVGHHLTVFLLS